MIEPVIHLPHRIREKPGPVRGTARATILVIDDDEMALTIVRRMLEAEKFSVDVSLSAREALALLPGNRYDAILCDMWMPGMTGKEFYQRVKKELPEYKDRIIFLTGDIASEATWEFIDQRRLPYILKPFSLPELRRKLEEVIGERTAPASPARKEGADQRRYRRIAIKANVQVRKKKWATGGPDVAQVVNVSKEGISFLTDRQYRVGTEVLVSFPYTGVNDVEQEGYVVRVEERLEGWQGVAIVLGEAAVAARNRPLGSEADRRRQQILAMADLANQTTPPAPLTEEEADAAALKLKVAAEREEARRLAEELADLKATYEHIATQRDRLAAEEVHLNLQLRELTATKSSMTEAVDNLKQEMETLQQRLAAGEVFRFQATHDALTGLWNRLGILDILRREVVRAGREGAPVGIILCDLDHFKNINDTYGHLAGDAVLREAARKMTSSVRVYDAVGRYGGEEFLIVLPGCDTATTMNQAERIREHLASEPVATEEGAIPVTVSMGAIAYAGGVTQDVDSLLRAADAALYRAKRGGRNRVELARAEETPNPQPAPAETAAK